MSIIKGLKYCPYDSYFSDSPDDLRLGSGHVKGSSTVCRITSLIPEGVSILKDKVETIDLPNPFNKL